ncbi:MAG: GNAT family N-acetyltransferase [Bacteroidales bacterium]|jgi:GNAT superfamily N-acetyltransferase|nr:GNAT family N-acetyltransferase [Bacteroidales bacterium]
MAVISAGLKKADRKRIEEILRSTDFFYDFEIQIALEIADDTISLGMDESGYYWLTISDDDGLVAFSNYGKDDFSTHSWDLYWIAVDHNSRHKKLGSALLKAVEDDVRKRGGKILWIDTSGRPLYAATEGFYIKNGYKLQASLKDYYAPGDPKQIYSKVL